MDSLHVTSQQTTGSKTSSRSTSPCRPREHHTHHAPHHTKTLSHGSDSGKVRLFDGSRKDESEKSKSRSSDVFYEFIQHDRVFIYRRRRFKNLF
ncbi:hypothetical protein TcasGA2_TC032408 [Tribolium castaneum]|uniref:Uncharacterized protein n=1 Tax=Tribolium castaneum TaxID=7070 RepID=A0A139WLC0_TRICA|nr:hypothetical protein TcasGA2_TC032408 [Tribolium castaneum]